MQQTRGQGSHWPGCIWRFIYYGLPGGGGGFYLKTTSKRGAFTKKLLPNGGLDEGKGGGGLLEEKWGFILRDFTLKQQSD